MSFLRKEPASDTPADKVAAASSAGKTEGVVVGYIRVQCLHDASVDEPAQNLLVGQADPLPGRRRIDVGKGGHNDLAFTTGTRRLGRHVIKKPHCGRMMTCCGPAAATGSDLRTMRKVLGKRLSACIDLYYTNYSN